MNASRRGFLKGLTGVAAMGAGGCFSIGKVRNGRIRLAAVGVMGKGYSDWTPMLKSGMVEMVAFCDADYTMREKAQARLIAEGIDFDMYRVPFYTDYRRLLSKRLDGNRLLVPAAERETIRDRFNFLHEDTHYSV